MALSKSSSSDSSRGNDEWLQGVLSVLTDPNLILYDFDATIRELKTAGADEGQLITDDSGLSLPCAVVQRRPTMPELLEAFVRVDLLQDPFSDSHFWTHLENQKSPVLRACIRDTRDNCRRWLQSVRQSPFLSAARRGDVVQMKQLVAREGQGVADAVDDQGYNAMFWAIQSGATAAVNYLLALRGERAWKDGGGRNLLHMAAFASREMVEFLFRTALKQEQLVDLLMMREVNASRGPDMMPLHYAVRAGNTDLVKEIGSLLARVGLRYLLNAADSCGATPLHLAAIHGMADIVDLLLESGACSYLINDTLQTPADLADINGHVAVSDKLKSKMASMDNLS